MTVKVRVYPHNDLLNLAHYHKCIVNDKIVAKNEEALALDCLSCIIALAFSVEALVNFVGAKKISSWKERQPFHAKIKELGSAIGLAYNKAADPYQTIEKLKKLRDQIAHGQPFEGGAVVTLREGLKKAMKAPWDPFLEPAFVNQAYDQVIAFEKELLALAKIPLVETLTSGFGSWTET